MSKKDDELKVTDGVYTLPCVEVIFKLVNQIQAWGDDTIKKIVLGYLSTVYFVQVRTQEV
jgi:hypothetical protein